MKTIDYINTLFDENDFTCFAKHAQGTKVFRAHDYEQVMTWAQYLSINALHPTQDLNPTEEYHAPDKPRRADHNVVKYRNILIEMDNVPLEEQIPLFKQLGIPYSTITYSGGKSYHFIISLQTPARDKAFYDSLVKDIYTAINLLSPNSIDKANKNPSRLSRMPNVIREDKGKVQELIEVCGRVNNELIEEWLEVNLPEEVQVAIAAKRLPSEYYDFIDQERAKYGLKPLLSPWLKNFMMFGAGAGERNTSVFRASCELLKKGYSIDEALEVCQNVVDLSKTELERTVRSAYNKVKND